MDTVKIEPHLEAVTLHVAGRLAIHGFFVAADNNVLMDPGSGITAMSKELVEALWE